MSTKTEQAEAELRKYTSIEDMKAHVKDIADKVGCAKATVYKVINRLAESEPKLTLPESREPVVKIKEPEEVPMPTAEEEELEEEGLGLEGEGEIPPSPEAISEKEELQPEEEKPEKKAELTIKMLRVIFKKPFQIAAKLTDCPDINLTDDEQTELAEAWLPYLEENLPEQFPLIYAGYVTVMVVGSKALIYNDFRKKQEAEKPKEEPPKEQAKEESSEDLDQKKMKQKASFMKKL